MTSSRAGDGAIDGAVDDVTDHIVDDAVRPTSPCELPPWLGEALSRLLIDAPPTASYSLEPQPESVTAARHFTVSTLRTWGVGGLEDDVALVVSELVTNALRHSAPPYARMPDEPGTIRLRLLRDTPYLLCGVVDPGVSAPRHREPDFIAETGRGLHIVSSFSERWGWTPLPEGGKIVWALFTVE